MQQKDFVSKDRLINENTVSNKLIEIFTKWEVLLVILFVIMVILFSNLNPYFLNTFNLFNAQFQFLEKSIMALPMIFIIMCGDIDISIASIIALASYGIGAGAAQGASIFTLIIIALAIGASAGFVNGFLTTKLGMPAIAVTLATQSIYRGIPKGILGEKALTKYPESFGFFGQSFLPGTIIPFELIVFIAMTVIFALVMQKTSYGRKLYAIGNNKEASKFSGVNVNKIRVINFTIMGLICGLCAVLLSSRILSVRSEIAIGWDMEVITLVVLGGVSISGGKGNVLGVTIASLLVGYLKFGMGLLKFQGTTMTIIIGSLLIVAVLVPRLLDNYKARRQLLRQQHKK